MSQQHTQTKKDTYVIDLLLEAMRSHPDIFPRVVKPVSTQLNAKKLLDGILSRPDLFRLYVRLGSIDVSLLTPDGIFLRNTFLEICPNIRELTPDAKKLLDGILGCPSLFSDYIRLVLTDVSLLTPDGIVLRNTFLEICPNIPNLV